MEHADTRHHRHHRALHRHNRDQILPFAKHVIVGVDSTPARWRIQEAEPENPLRRLDQQPRSGPHHTPPRPTMRSMRAPTRGSRRPGVRPDDLIRVVLDGTTTKLRPARRNQATKRRPASGRLSVRTRRAALGQHHRAAYRRPLPAAMRCIPKDDHSRQLARRRH